MIELSGQVPYAKRQAIADELRRRLGPAALQISEGRVTSDRASNPMSVWLHIKLSLDEAPAVAPAGDEHC